MKKIAIPNIEKPIRNAVRTSQKMYRVSLGTGKENTFRSHKDALAFLAEVNRNLNLFMHEINVHYTELFRMYRHLWFYFLDRSKGVNRTDLERTIKVSFDVVDSNLNRAIHNTSGMNGNSFAFHFLTGAVAQLQNIADSLREITIKRNELVNRYKIEVQIKQLADLYSRIDGYGVPKNNMPGNTGHIQQINMNKDQ